ncbi:MAG: flagellar assembly protein A, partial [Clostridium sp.]
MRYLYSIDNLESECEKIKQKYGIDKLNIQDTNKEEFIKCITIFEPRRIFNIKAEENNFKLYGNIIYEPGLKYYLKTGEDSHLQVWEDVVQAPIAFTNSEIKEILVEKGIKIGVIEEAITNLLESKTEFVLIGEGIKPVDDEQDYIKTYFDNKIKNFEEESLKNIDFRNLYSISTAKIGDVIGEKIIGKEGRDGLDIYGNKVPKKIKKKININTYTGCEIKENKVVALIDGKPSIKGNTFSVTSVYNIPTNVDLNSGNVNFVGEVVIEGSIKEGMKVTSGSGVIVKGNVENAEINAKGNIVVGGNIIKSTIKTGAKDVEKNNALVLLENYKESLDGLIKSVVQIKEYNIKASNSSDGELIKLLIESKFKNLVTTAMNIITLTITGVISDKSISEFIKSKIMGLNTLNIKSSNELYDLISIIDDEISGLKAKVNLKLDVNIAYCQDTKIEASGDINILGKGQYISDMKSLGAINFINKSSVCRGGTLEAKDVIHAGIIGTPSGAITTLKVNKGGVITAKTVYANTKLFVGERTYTFEH